MSGGNTTPRGTGAECRKFAPNIFNKSKCSSCFKQKEEHSAEALECNRATRKISKCGYLFVAPGWDFSNPLNRTKDWNDARLKWDPTLYENITEMPIKPWKIWTPELSHRGPGTADKWADTYDFQQCFVRRKGYVSCMISTVYNIRCDTDFTTWPYDRQYCTLLLASWSHTGEQVAIKKHRWQSRWQRRWFVLYDDGELTYSVDEHPETVPQARIDMTRVLEVAAAEDVTGHPYSLAVTSPEGVTFVKGTCREETRWWADVLQVYSRNKGRHKRNATFPGGQTTILQVTPTIRSNTPNPPRPRFNSCRSEPRSAATSWNPETSSQDLCNSTFNPVTNSSSITTSLGNDSLLTTSSINGTASSVAENGNVSRGALQVSPLRNSLLENGATHAYGNPSSGSLPISSNNSSPNATNVSSMAVNGGVAAAPTTIAITPNSTMVVGSEKPPMVPNDGRNYRDQPASSASPPTRDKLRAEDKARRRMNHHQLNQDQLNQPQGERSTSGVGGGGCVENNEKLDDDACRRILLEHEREREGKLRDIAASLTQPRIRRNKPRTSEPTRDVVDAANAAHQDKLIRGDPDGCGLDISGTRYSPTSELRVDLPAEDLLNIKKGWLMKQGLNKEWNKHWFVLRGCGLMYYRDPSTEDKGIMDGVIDLNTVTAVTPVQVARNYGFQTVTWDDRGTTLLSAVTAGIRSSWMSAIRRAANLPDPDNPAEGGLVSCQDSQTDAKPPPQSPTVSMNERERDSVVLPSTPLTPRSVLFSSDEEYRTASEGGRRESGDWSEIPVSPPPPLPPLSARNGGDWSLSLKGSNWSSDNANHEWSELPPSPPLTRTALSRVKARSRSSSRSRVYKRSRSSPPSSRTSTLDSVRSEDLVMACCELGEPDDERSNGHLSSSNNSSGCLPSANDNPLIVELLESQVTMLRDQLDQNQSHPSALLVIVERQENEIESLKSQVNTARSEVASAEEEIARLRQQKAEAAAVREKQIEELLGSVQRSEQQRGKDLDDFEKMKMMYARDKESLECKLLETEAMLRETSERCETLGNEVSSSHRTVEHLQAEMTGLSDKLSQGIEENERLYTRMRELEGKSGLSASRERGCGGRSFDSLSDLTNIDLELDLSGFDKERIMEEFEELRGRFEKAVLEIRAMRKELREAHTTQDALELEMFAHKQDASRVAESNQAQVQLMAARIQDLTGKLAASEKQVRSLKQKLTKAETRDKRRSLSLKGRESFQISQELEDKLSELETKISAIERGKCAPISVATSSSSKDASPNARKERKRENKSLDRGRLRRKSLDSATSSEPMKVLIRLSTLETKVANVAETTTATTTTTTVSDAEKDSSECSETSGGPGATCQISQEIVARLRKLERVVSKSKRRLEKCLGSTQAEEKAEKCLREVNDILESCVEWKKTQQQQQQQQQPSGQASESVGVVVARLETILRDKMTELTERRRKLSDTDRLDDRAKLRLLAERIAFESVVLRQIKCAMSRSRDRSGVLSELVETSHLISNLKCKVYGTKPKMYQNTSYIEYLTRILANKLVMVGGAACDSETSEARDTTTAAKEVSAAKNETREYLLRKQREVNDIMQRYKDTKLRELAEALAAETLSLSDQEELGKQQQIAATSNKLLEDRRIREAWALAQETVNKELVQAEVSHVIMRCGQMYEQSITSASDTCLNFENSVNLSLERWADEAQAKLREEMEFSIQELTASYEDSLRRMKKGKNNISQSQPPRQYDSRQLLNDYADVIAQKALIDARIALLKEEQPRAQQNRHFRGETSFVSSLIKHEDVLARLTSLTNEDGGEGENDDDPLVDAEFVYLYKQFSSDCEEKIAGKGRSKDQLKIVAQSLTSLEEDLADLRTILREKDAKDTDRSCRRRPARALTSIDADWSDVCEKCKDLRDEIRRLGDYVRNMTCKQCSILRESIERLTVQHGEEMEKLRKNQERDLMDMKGELDNQRHSLTTQYEEEAASLRERARKLEHRLNAMDSEHSAHVNELRAAYQRSITAELDTDAETRKRYKEEIKQLRGLCEKGLLAMENSHRRIIAEMEEKHRQELENLRVEKEQALSEETQATLAALDAMRKAHEHEVQKEIAKFKQEFIKQMQAREDIGALHKEHEEEMEEIKQEILSLSSKYSSKCVESAALEEKVGSLTKQLAQAQQHIMQLDARNKQLRAYLVLETNDSGAINEPIQLLRSRDNEIAKQREEIHRLQQQLKHGESRRETGTSGVTIKSASLSCYAPPYATHRSSNDDTKILRTASEDTKFPSPSLRKSYSEDTPATNFSYKLERIKSVSLPYAAADLREPNARRNIPQQADKNGMNSTLWDSLRPRAGLPQQYQGCSAAMRVGKPGVEWPENEQSEKQQQQQQQQQQHHHQQQQQQQQQPETHTVGGNSRCAPRLTPEPSALSVAELMRSPPVRWSGRSCSSLPSTPTPGYPNSLYPPLPAVGMVAERKKRFEL